MSDTTLQARPMIYNRFQYLAEIQQLSDVNLQVGSRYNVECMPTNYAYENKEVIHGKSTLRISNAHKVGEVIPTRFIAYLRVSSKKQDIKQQKNAIKNMVRGMVKEWDENGLPIMMNPDCVTEGGDILWVEEKLGTSAWEKRKKSSLQYRPIGEHVYHMIENNLTEKVFVSELSRLYRNMACAAMFREDLRFEWNTNADVYAPRFTQGMKDKAGAIAITIQMLQDEDESEVKSDRVSNATEVMREEDLSCTKYTWGWNRYLTGQQTKHKKDEYKTEPNWHEQSIREYCLDKIENEGWSLAKSARFLDNLGMRGKAGGQWTSAQITRSFYKVKMNRVLGNHPRPLKMPSYPWTAYRKSVSDL